MRKWVAQIAGIVCLTLCFGVAHASNMKEGNEAYKGGDWSAAIASYESLAASGLMNEDLYYNLGNAYFRAGQYGRAIFSYEQALRIAPNSEDAAYNLVVSREVVSARSTNQLRDADGMPWWLRFSLYISISQSTMLLLALNAIFFVGLALRRYLPSGFRRTVVVVLLGFLGVAVVLFALMLGGHVYANENIFHGIVTNDLVIMREGPDANLEERGQLHAGLRVTVVTREPNWLLVRLSNGVEGWVPRASIGLFR